MPSCSPPTEPPASSNLPPMCTQGTRLHKRKTGLPCAGWPTACGEQPSAAHATHSAAMRCRRREVTAGLGCMATSGSSTGGQWTATAAHPSCPGPCQRPSGIHGSHRGLEGRPGEGCAVSCSGTFGLECWGTILYQVFPCQFGLPIEIDGRGFSLLVIRTIFP